MSVTRPVVVVEPREPHAQQLELRDERGLLLRVLYERVAAVAVAADLAPPQPARASSDQL
jgi:hypothetical protein